MDAFDDFDLFRRLWQMPIALCTANTQNVMKTDVKETDDGYEVDVDLPGFKKDEIHLKLNDECYLTISAEKSLEKGQGKTKRAKMFRQSAIRA